MHMPPYLPNSTRRTPLTDYEYPQLTPVAATKKLALLISKAEAAALHCLALAPRPLGVVGG
jgi:hypothetical protein